MPASATYKATVFNATDPANLNRVRLLVPQVYGALPSPWAEPSVLGTPAPAAGDTVWCWFNGGDHAHPVYASTKLVKEGDSRLSNARTPTAHATTHQPGGSDPLAVDAAAATGSLRTLGTSSTSAAAGNDSRLSNSRTPTAHAASHQEGGSDTLFTPPAFTTPTLLNSWVAYGTPWSDNLGYRKVNGMVEMSGLIKNGTVPSVAFSLPVGYRPRSDLIFVTAATDAFGQIRVHADGSVIMQTGTNTWFSLAPIHFRAEL